MDASRATAVEPTVRRGPARGVPDPGGLEAAVETRERGVVLRVCGTLRARSAPTLRDAVTAALRVSEAPPPVVVVDLTTVIADDELGLWVLPAMAGDLERVGSALLITVPARRLRMRLRRLGARHLEITETAPDLGAVVARGAVDHGAHDATG